MVFDVRSCKILVGFTYLIREVPTWLALPANGSPYGIWYMYLEVGKSTWFQKIINDFRISPSIHQQYFTAK